MKRGVRRVPFPKCKRPDALLGAGPGLVNINFFLVFQPGWYKIPTFFSKKIIIGGSSNQIFENVLCFISMCWPLDLIFLSEQLQKFKIEFAKSQLGF